MSFLNLANFWQSIKKGKFLLLALLLGLTLRGLNSTFGSPSLSISNDEAIFHLSAFNMLAVKTPVSIANYTPLGTYIQIPFLIFSYFAMNTVGIVSNLSDFELFLLSHPGYFLFIPRLISAFFGALTVLVVYKITLELFGKRTTAIIAAFLTAVSFNLVHISHFARPWSAALFFFVLGIYLALKQKRFLAPFVVAVSFGFHQAGILAVPLIVWKLYKRPLILSVVGFLIMAIIIFGFNLLTLRVGVIDAIARDQSFIKEGKFLADLILGKDALVVSFYYTLRENLSVYFLINLLVTDGILVIFGAVGLFKYLQYKKAHIEIFFYIFLYFIFASLFFHPLIRYLLPILVLLTPFSAFAIDNLFGRKKFLLIFVILIASINSLWWNWLFLKKPTFIQAHEWVNNHIGEDRPIAYTGGRFATFAPDASAIKHMQTSSSNAFQRLLSIDGNYYGNLRNIIYLDKFPGKSKFQQLENATFNYPVEYVIDYYLDEKERIFNFDPGSFEIVARISPTDSDDLASLPEPLFDPSWNFATNDKREKVSMYSLERIGPYVDILKVKSY